MLRRENTRRAGSRALGLFLALFVFCVALASCSTDATTVEADPSPSSASVADVEREDVPDAGEPVDADVADGGADSGSDDTDAPATGSAFSVLDALRLIPLSATEDAASSLQVSVADVDAAADQARLRRPADPGDPEQLYAFIGPMTGASRDGRAGRVFVPFPRTLIERALFDVDEFVAEVGFSTGDVTSFAALEAPPAQFVVLGGVSAPAGLPEVGTGVSTIGLGEDFATDVTATSAARPLGRPLRVAARDGYLALSLATAPIVEWAADEPTPTLADNDLLAALANRLDEESVVSAALFITDGPPFQSVGLGWSADDRGPQGVIVLHYGSASAAQEDLSRVSGGFDARSLTTQQPISELIELEDIEVRGAEIVAVVTFPNDRDPITTFQMLLQQDIPFGPSA